MSDHALSNGEFSGTANPRVKSAEGLFWMVLQPVLVLGSAFGRYHGTGEWMNHKLYALVIDPRTPPHLRGEDLGEAEGLQLEPRELAEDGFWLAFGAFPGARSSAASTARRFLKGSGPSATAHFWTSPLRRKA